MGSGEIIAITVIALIILGALFYIIKAKKSGKRCIGCPSSVSCNGTCHSCKCDCKSQTKYEE